MAEGETDREEGAGPSGATSSAPGLDPFGQLSGLEEAEGCVGAKLDELGGTTLGRIDGFLADALDGSPTWLIVRLGRFGRRAAVPFEFVAPGVGHVWVPFSRDVIRAASELDPVGGLSSADERELAAHYGIPDGGGRLATLGERADEDPGSVPA